MHDYKGLYLKLLRASDEAITAIEHMNFGAARELLMQAQRETEEQWVREEETEGMEETSAAGAACESGPVR